MSIIFNTPHRHYGLQSFISGSTNKLLIIGYSGSGKTTVAKKLAHEYDAQYVSLDDFFFNNQHLKIANPARYTKRRTEYENKILFREGRYVIEGVGIMRNTSSEIYEIPTVVLGTSLIVSSIRGGIRNCKQLQTSNSFYKELITPFSKNIDNYHHLVNIYVRELQSRHKLKKFAMKELNQ